MMYPRLRLLRELLREDGSIWISIDDNEVHNLRALMDEIFGHDNFAACCVWHKMDSPKNTAAHFSVDHDYVLVYAKSIASWKLNLVPRTEAMLARYKNPDEDPRGPWIGSDLDARNYYSKGAYPILLPSGRTIPGPPPGAYWRVSAKKLKALDADNRIWWGAKGDSEPQMKRFLSEVKTGVVPQTIWDWRRVGSTRHAKSELVSILGKAGEDEDVFATPKPVHLIRHVLSLATDGNSIVLDSFAGSGTTGHAVLAENQQDHGQRKFILVQQPYDNRQHEQKGLNLCSQVTAERVRRAVRGYDHTKRGPEGKTVKGHEVGLGGSFTYARVGAPLLGDNRTWGERMPSYEELAKYILYTETGKELDPKKGNAKTGKIGEHGGASYYLLYTPDPKASVPLDQKVLDALAKDRSPRKVVYCEKVWVHREDLAKMRKEIGEVRTMLLPFQVRAS